MNERISGSKTTHGPDTSSARNASQDGRVRSWKLGFAAALCVLVVVAGIRWRSLAAPKATNSTRGPAAFPVSVLQATKVDVPVYLTGLGSVTPLHTVTVHSRVDGQLMEVLFQEGQIVKKGQPLATIDSRTYEVQLRQAQGQLAKDEALLKNARVDLQRYRGLWAKDSAPRQQMDTQEALVRQYEAALQVDRGQIDAAKLLLDYCHITAPVEGRIGLRSVDPGNIVHANDATGLAVITQMQPISVIFTLPEDSLPRILERMRQGDHLPVDAFDRDLRNKLTQGELLTIDNQISTSTGTVRLKAIFPNRNGELFPNQFVNALMLVEVIKNAIVVPNTAVQHTTQGTSVFVVKDDHTVEARPVKTGISTDGSVIVEKGLAEGEMVVIDGADRLRQGAQVEIKPESTGTKK